MTEGQVIKFMCVILLCPGVGMETVTLAARTCLALHYRYIYMVSHHDWCLSGIVCVHICCNIYVFCGSFALYISYFFSMVTITFVPI